MALRLGQPSEPVELSHDGQTITAARGEPLALSLIAADRLLLSRSPKLHRPRGPYCLRDACEGCLVRVNGIPNQPACRVVVRGGEQVETQNVLGTRETDLLAAADFLFPQGIDHHRLMAGVRGVSPILQSFARRVAGLGRLANHAEPLKPAERVEVQVLIVGGGRAGLSAAATFDKRATLVDDGHQLGGALTALDPRAAQTLAAVAAKSGAQLWSRSSVLALSREPDDGSGRITALVVTPERSYVVRADAVVLATGRHDAVPAFPNNDLPGVFSARAALLAWQSDVLVGQRIGLVGSGRFAARLSELMSGAVELVPLDASAVLRVKGRERVTGVETRLDGKTRQLKLDALAFDGPGAPSFELGVQAGGTTDFVPEAGYFLRADARGRVAERVYAAGARLDDVLSGA